MYVFKYKYVYTYVYNIIKQAYNCLSFYFWSACQKIPEIWRASGR